jgi:hypothetical protein
MGFCKELLEPKKEKTFPQPNWAPGEKEAAARAWWETGVESTLESLRSSVRMQRILITLLIIILASR